MSGARPVLMSVEGGAASSEQWPTLQGQARPGQARSRPLHRGRACGRPLDHRAHRSRRRLRRVRVGGKGSIGGTCVGHRTAARRLLEERSHPRSCPRGRKRPSPLTRRTVRRPAAPLKIHYKLTLKQRGLDPRLPPHGSATSRWRVGLETSRTRRGLMHAGACVPPDLPSGPAAPWGNGQPVPGGTLRRRLPGQPQPTSRARRPIAAGRRCKSGDRH